MSDAARWMVAIGFIALPTIAYGGYFLLSVLKRKVGTENITPIQKEYFRAGHAHAGVLVTLSIIGQIVLDYANFNDWLTWTFRIGLLVSPILISAGFFGGAPRTEGGPAGPLVKLISIGAVIFSISALGVGIGLLLPQ